MLRRRTRVATLAAALLAAGIPHAQAQLSPKGIAVVYTGVLSSPEYFNRTRSVVGV